MATKVRKALATRKVKQAIRKIEPEVAKEILEAEATRAEAKAEVTERRPGLTVGGHKIAWTYTDMAQFPVVEVHSEENVKITWNGLDYQLLQGAIHYLPDVIAREYYNHRNQSVNASRNIKKDFAQGFETVIELGAGALPPQ